MESKSESKNLIQRYHIFPALEFYKPTLNLSLTGSNFLSVTALAATSENHSIIDFVCKEK